MRVRVRACLLPVALAVLLSPAAASAAEASEAGRATGATSSAAPTKRRPVITARLGAELVLGAEWASVPLNAYGCEGVIGVPVDAGSITLTPGIGFGWIGGQSEHDLRFSASTLSLELELSPREKLRWFRVGIGGGTGSLRFERATGGGDITETVLHFHLMPSADVLRLDEWFAFWTGVAGRIDGSIASFVVLAGVRI